MNFFDYWKNLSEGTKTLLISLVVGIITFLFLWEFKLKYQYSKKVSKKVLCRAYKVKPKILKKWIETFGSKKAGAFQNFAV